MRRLMSAIVIAIAAALSATGAAAQNLESVMNKVPPSMAQDLDTLRRYADEVSRRSGAKGNRPARADETDTPPRDASPRPAPAGTPERDPFEVSPRLREANPRSLATGAGGSRISRAWRLKALVSGPLGRIAQITSMQDDPTMEAMTVRDRDEVDFEGQRYVVKMLPEMRPDHVELTGKGAPQLKVIIR